MLLPHEGGERLVNLSAKEKASLKNGSPLMPPQSAADVETMQQMASGLQSVKGGQEKPAKKNPKRKKKKVMRKKH